MITESYIYNAVRDFIIHSEIEPLQKRAPLLCHFRYEFDRVQSIAEESEKRKQQYAWNLSFHAFIIPRIAVITAFCHPHKLLG